jgi:hypothetical protein
LSSGTGDTLTPQLRLASARRRVGAFLEQIQELQDSNFPHDDGREALRAIRADVEIRLNFLNTLPSSIKDLRVINTACINAMLVVSRHTPVLGFILRSTNVRNPFELHYPLKRTLQQVVDPNVHLIISAEWDFEPLTYPLTLDTLPDFILIGTPASEASNALITPLAGHEMGHSAWTRHRMQAQVEDDLYAAIDAALEADAEYRARILASLKTAGHSLQNLRQHCLKFGLRQLEELYCDYIGLYVFGASYLYAFDYFLAPGVGGRSERYPSNQDRGDYVTAAARQLGVEVDLAILHGWEPQTFAGGLQGDALPLTDRAVARMNDRVRDLAFAHLEARGVARPDDTRITHVLESFRRQEPDASGASLPEIICAGWRYLRDAGGLSGRSDRDELKMLNELILKSVEVSEFQFRTGDDAERP